MLFFLLLLVIIAIPQISFAAKGYVVYYKFGCSYYIVETNNGYAILEWFGGTDPSEGDIIVGNFESYGMKTLYDVTSDSETRAWVEDYWLSKTSVIEKYLEHCD